MPDELSAEDPESILAALPGLIGDNEHLRSVLNDRVVDLMNNTFDQIEDVLLTGDPRSRNAILTKLLPELLKVRNKAETETGGQARKRAEIQKMFTEMGAGFGEAGVGDEGDDDDWGEIE